MSRPGQGQCFDGDPRLLGVDEQGREILSYVVDRPALPPLPTDDEAARYGLPTEGRGERLRGICDAYGLEERGGGVEPALDQRRDGYELHRELGGERRQPGWREVWDACSGQTILTGVRWLEENRPELERWL